MHSMKHMQETKYTLCVLSCIINTEIIKTLNKHDVTIINNHGIAIYIHNKEIQY